MKHFFTLAVTAFAIHHSHAAPWSLSVVDDKGAPVAKAAIRIAVPMSQDLRLSTDERGRVTGDLTPLYSQEYLGEALILAPGHAPTGLSLQVGENRVALATPRSVQGRVVDADGKPVANVVVELTSVTRHFSEETDEEKKSDNSSNIFLSKPDREAFAARTDADGRYEIGGLPQRGLASFVVVDPTRVATAARLNLKENGPVPDLKLRPAARLRGRVLMPDGTPAVKMSISVFSPEAEDVFSGETDAEGRYTIGGLPAGTVEIYAGDKQQNTVAIASEIAVQTAEGAETIVPDIQMETGAVVEITLRAGAPFTGGAFSLRKVGLPNSLGGIQLLPQNGFLSTRVPAGDYHLIAGMSPDGWLAPAETEGKGLLVRAVNGETTKLELKLTPALVLEGTIRDEAGQPVAGVSLQQYSDGSRAVSDANGGFSLRNLKPGNLLLATDDKWSIVSPGEFKIPSKPIVVTVKKNLLVPAQGRVVDDKGAPVPEARVVVQWDIPIVGSDGGSRGARGIARTDADGRFVIPNVPATAKPTVTATKDKHRLLSGGGFWIADTIPGINGAPIPNPNASFNATDIVMQPLVRTASGRVVDAEGKPVANAVVGALGGGISTDLYGPAPRNITRTDAQGRFTLEDLPADELSFVAGAGDGFVQVQSNSTVLPDLVLQPLVKPQRDLEAAHELVMELIEATRAGDYYARNSLPYTLAPYDLEAAREAADAIQPGGKATKQMQRFLMWHQVRANTEQGRAMALQLVTELEKEVDSTPTSLVIFLLPFLPQPEKAEVAGEDENDAALRSFVRRSFAATKTKLAKLDLDKHSDLQTAYSFASLAALAARLGDTDALQLAQNAITIGVRYAQAQKDERGSIDAVVEGLANGGAKLVEAVLPNMPPEKRAGALGRVIPVIAQRDMAGARRLLETLPSQIKPENADSLNAVPERAFGLAAKNLIGRMTVADAANALALARRVTHEWQRAEALALAARLQSADEAAKLWREAYAMSREILGDRQESRIAAIALNTNRAVGEELLLKIEDSFFAPRDFRHGETPSAPAFYLSRVQPGRAKAWLEWKWAEAQNGINGINGPIDLRGIAMAMAAVDIKRALEMATSIPPKRSVNGEEDFNWRWEAQRKIAQFLVAPEAVRQTMPFDRWEAGDTWTPGEETGW
ncbi:MAG TPA: carboxypeptidase-like regulatory domain-containing protein [Abditibacteriaceae bacterium]|jgi:hypothetical protein